MSERPTLYQRRMLEQLDLRGGVTSRMVVQALGYSNLRQESQLMRMALDHLCAKGWAKRMDDQRPICWLLTEAGAEALKS